MRPAGRHVGGACVMQTVFVCGGRGTRLIPREAGPKSLVRLGGSSLLSRLVAFVGGFHRSKKPPVVIIDARDEQTPQALRQLLPDACVVRQGDPDGVANTLILAQPNLDDVVLVSLGDLFLDGTLSRILIGPGLVFWKAAPLVELRKNFGITIGSDGIVSRVIEKPVNSRGLNCGMGLYVLNRSIIDCFAHAPVNSRTGERGITAALHTAIEMGVSFRAIPFSGYYNNVNSHADVDAVERHLARKTG